MVGNFDIYTVSFFGHRYIDDIFAVEEKLRPIIENLLKTKEYVEFLIGRNGDFDQVAASTVRRVKKQFEHEDSSLILILPYVTAEFEKNEEYFYQYYDDIEICYEASRSHFKSAIGIRNRYMVDRSDLVICFVTHNSGGAYAALKYAGNMNKRILNIAGSV